jgi:molecular chaperone GrpE (heat shock protein)
MNWLKRLFRPTNSASALNTEPDELTWASELQSLRLELQERDRLVAQLKQDLERQRSGASAQFSQAAQAQLEQLLAETAGPVAQLVTQAHLLEIEGKPVPARDVLVVARRLVRILEDHGLALEGQVGETVQFDPNRHEPLQSQVTLTADQEVTVRFVGAAFHGKLLRKAGITPGRMNLHPETGDEVKDAG